MRTFTINDSVLNEILESIGSIPAESGGILGLQKGEEITRFFFDSVAAKTSATYSPSTDILDGVINGWEEDGVAFCGFIHSHPRGCLRPSLGDIHYAKAILDALDMDELLLPIVQHEEDGAVLLYPYVVRQDGADVKLEDAVFCLKDGRAINGVPLRREDLSAQIEDEDALFTSIFSRNLGLARLLREKTVIVIGCGGARSFCESLARSGVGRFVLVDADTVSGTNLATQGVFFDEIGRAKVEVLERSLRRINPAVRITAMQRFLDDDLTDVELEAAVGEELLRNAPEDILLCACTDRHSAQARTIRLALKWAVPFLSAGIYSRGVGAEIVFTHPDATPACPRCVLSSRFDALESLGGAEENVASSGCPIFVTDRLNAAKTHIALMLLLYRSGHPLGWQLDEVADRNLMLLSFSEHVDELGLSLFREAADSVGGWLSGSLQPVESALFIEQQPSAPQYGQRRCPWCGGTGHLRLVRGMNADTRRAWDLTAFLSAAGAEIEGDEEDEGYDGAAAPSPA